MLSVSQGFLKSHSPNHQYSEAVLVQYDENTISLAKLIEIHLRTHASSSQHSMRKKYRSAIYVDNNAMAERCINILDTLRPQFDNPLVTQVLSIVDFKRSSDSYMDYYATNPDRPFCITYIEPKLALLRRDFKDCLQIIDQK